jgi:CelD/BcsL family acetyltransferase involved in cellulose biosynthesis
VNRTLRLVLLREIPEDTNLRQEWDALVSRVARPQVFYTYEWALAVQRAYRTALHPLLFLAYDEDGFLSGLAALATNPSGSRVSFLCATTGDYCDFLSLPELKSAFVAGVLAELKKEGIGDITLTNLPADSDSVAAVRGASGQSGYRYFARTAYICAQVSLAELPRRPAENKPILPRKKMLRRFLNAMARDTPVRLDHARSWVAVQSILPQFIQTHVARFLATGRISNLAHAQRRLFLAELARLLSESGWLALTQMSAGETTFAWNYGFQFQDTWFWYQPTFDSDLEKYSPGYCLLAKMIEEAVDIDTLKIVDLGLGAEEYKDRFANQTRETLCVTLRSSAWQHVREVLRYYAVRIISASEGLEPTVRAGAAVLREFNDDGVAATLSRLRRRLSSFFWSETEVCFFEWLGPAPSKVLTVKLQPLDLNRLASAACQYAEDPSTLAYLLRSAARMREGNAEGFGLVDADENFLHFAWVTDFDGFFLSELGTKVEAPSTSCVLLFDCWTPVAARGHGHYGQTAGLIVKLLRQRGKQPWIFSAAANVASMRGLQKAGFQQRYSLIRQRILGWQRIKGKTPKIGETLAPQVSASI